jgi:hypothetical protein
MLAATLLRGASAAPRRCQARLPRSARRNASGRTPPPLAPPPPMANPPAAKPEMTMVDRLLRQRILAHGPVRHTAACQNQGAAASQPTDASRCVLLSIDRLQSATSCKRC